MAYRLLKKSFGIKGETVLAETGLDVKITSMCRIEDGDFLFTAPYEHCVGRIKDGKVELEWLGKQGYRKSRPYGSRKDITLDTPCSVVYFESNDSCYLIEECGKKFSILNLQDDNLDGFFSKSLRPYMDRLYSKINPVINISSCCDSSGIVYSAYPLVNRIFVFDECGFSAYMGCGKAGFSVSRSLTESKLCFPEGVCSVRGSLYVADTGNHCIRRISKGVSRVVAGRPDIEGDENGFGTGAKLMSPQNIKAKGIFGYFIDDVGVTKKIKHLALNNMEVGTAYEGPNVIDIECNKKRDLFILEKI